MFLWDKSHVSHWLGSVSVHPHLRLALTPVDHSCVMCLTDWDQSQYNHISGWLLLQLCHVSHWLGSVSVQPHLRLALTPVDHSCVMCLTDWDQSRYTHISGWLLLQLCHVSHWLGSVSVQPHLRLALTPVDHSCVMCLTDWDQSRYNHISGWLLHQWTTAVSCVSLTGISLGTTTSQVGSYTSGPQLCHVSHWLGSVSVHPHLRLALTTAVSCVSLTGISLGTTTSQVGSYTSGPQLCHVSHWLGSVSVHPHLRLALTTAVSCVSLTGISLGTTTSQVGSYTSEPQLCHVSHWLGSVSVQPHLRLALTPVDHSCVMCLTDWDQSRYNHISGWLLHQWTTAVSCVSLTGISLSTPTSQVGSYTSGPQLCHVSHWLGSVSVQPHLRLALTPVDHSCVMCLTDWDQSRYNHISGWLLHQWTTAVSCVSLTGISLGTTTSQVGSYTSGPQLCHVSHWLASVSVEPHLRLALTPVDHSCVMCLTDWD